MSSWCTLLVAASAALAESESQGWSLPKEAAQELRRFEGEWTATGEVTGMALEGKWSGRRAPRGHCVSLRYDLTLDGEPVQGSGVAGWDTATREIFIVAFFSSGVLEECRYKRVKPGVLEGTYRGSAQGKSFEARGAVRSIGPDEWTFNTTGLKGSPKPGELSVRFTRAGKKAAAVQPGSSYEHLKFLDPLVGHWRTEAAVDGEKTEGQFQAKWGPGKYWLTWSAETWAKDDRTLINHGSGIIAWDPAERRVRELAAISDGTLATAYFQEEDGKLVIERSGALADGTRFTTRPEGVFKGDRYEFGPSVWKTPEGKVVQELGAGFFERVGKAKPSTR